MKLYLVVRTGLLCLLLASLNICFAQDSSVLAKALGAPDKVFVELHKKAESIESKLAQSTEKYLSKLQKQESKLRKKLFKKDSTLAHQLFDGVGNQYNKLKGKADGISKLESVYSGHLDSLSTALNFLKGSPVSSYSNSPELQKTLAQYGALQDKLNASENIKKYLEARQALLSQHFQSLGMIKELKQFQKQVYYYKAQVQEYKQAFEDPTKLEQKLMELVMKVPQFKDFFAKNSVLGSLFALPGSGGSSTASIQGLQTRAMINQSLVDRFGSGADISQQLQQNLQSAQGQLSDLRSRLGQYTSGGYGNSASDPSMPNFKPNEEKTRSFKRRLQLGTNIQTQKARYMFPATSDLGLSLGYKLNQNSVIGVGASAKIGLGSSWSHIAITYQGVGLRSFLEYKLKGSFFASGGFELNYRKLITSTAQLKNYSAWQRSGLIGISKQYSINKKFKGDLKLLWDFLSYQQIPRTQPIIFRFGYSIK